MLISLLVGTTIGLILALPPGPVGVTAIKIGMSKGQKSGVQLALGTGLMDFIYCLIAIFATSAAVNAIKSISGEYPFLILVFQLSVVVAFVVLGIVNLNTKKDANPLDNKSGKILDKFKSKGPFLLGIAVATANMANPTFLPTLAWVTMNVHAYELILNNHLSNLMFAIGFGIGNFLWLYVLVRIIVRYKDSLSSKMVIRIRQFAGVTFLGFGTILGVRLISIVKWPELLRLVFAF